MFRLWRAPLSLLLVNSFLSSCASAANLFENTAIVRTVELGGSLVHVTTTYAVRALEDGSRTYTIALGDSERDRTSWLDVKLKGESTPLPLEEFEKRGESGVHLYTVELPEALNVNDTATIVVGTVQTHATYPWPEQSGQKELQSLKYDSDLFVLSPYKTLVQRTKLRSPSPQVHSYTEPEGLGEFVQDAVATKSGATVTYGPYHNIPPTTQEFLRKTQKHITVHYQYDHPVIEVKKLERSAEISHWGANLNIEDNVHLHNAGPALKGHFSRLEYQLQVHYNRPAPHVIPSLPLHLPPGIHDVYYYDLIGNVSTSRLRTVPSVPKGVESNQFSVLELRPRYPIWGGWNYSFTLGWDAPLADYAGYDAKTGKYIVGVPIMTVIPGAVVDDASIKIVLPEGATDVDYFPPYPTLHDGVSAHVTYLDTIGRPTVTLYYSRLTDQHSGLVYVTYKVPLSAHFKKPVAVATAFFGVFALALAWKRVDTRIQRK